MEKKNETPYPKGSFPVKVSVESKGNGADSASMSQTSNQPTRSALTLLSRFVEEAQQKFQLTIVTSPTGDPHFAEATIAVPFPDREHIRIHFNIFASEMEDQHGTGLYFHMESAF